MMSPELNAAHDAIFAELHDFKTSGATQDPDVRREHVVRLRRLTDAKMRILEKERRTLKRKET